MTDEQINTAIAEACGWMHQNISRNAVYYIPTADLFVGKPTTDLNAMHEAEKVLNYKMLCDMEDAIDFYFIIHTFRANARQRAEAFLRTIGKWEEVQP